MLLAGPRREQSQAEEIANSISHGIGLAAALIGTPFLIMQAAQHGNVGFVVGTSLFSATTIFLYLASTIYHALPTGAAKHVFRILEHSAIFLLIAGTYTPFTLGVLHGVGGWVLLSTIWGLTAAGVVMKVLYKTALPILSTCLYLLMGWLVVIAADTLIAKMPTPGLLWLVAGGLSYTVGVVFFAIDSRLRYAHLIWHLFVMMGTTCHYFAVLWYGF